jgi:hypothetical protein
MLKAPMAPFFIPICRSGTYFVAYNHIPQPFPQIPLQTLPQYSPQKSNYGKVLRKASEIVYSFIHIIFTDSYGQ